MKLKRLFLAGGLIGVVLTMAGCEQKKKPSAASLKKMAAHTATGTAVTILEAHTQPEIPRANEVSIWSIKVFDTLPDPDGNRMEWKAYLPLPQPVGNANTSDVLMDAWMVSLDGSIFAPVRPSYKEYGSFVTDWTPPHPGDYRLFVEYHPNGKEKQRKYPVEMAHWDFKVAAGTSGLEPLSKTPHWTPSMNPAPITLNGLADGAPAGTLVFADLPSNSGEIKTVKITGAPDGSQAMEMAAISSGGTLIHFQPYVDGRSFMVSFPKSGLYKIWTYFSLNGSTYAAPVTRWIS